MAYGKNGAMCWLAGAVRTLQKRVEWLEARAQLAAGPAPVVEHILQAPAGYTAHAPVMEYISPEPSVYAVPAFDVEYFSTAPKVFYAAPAPAVYAAKAPVVEYIAPVPVTSYATHTFLQILQCLPQMSPVVEFIASAPVASYATPVPTAIVAAPVVELISRDPTVYAAPAPVVEHTSPDPTVYAAPAPVVEFISPAPVACYATAPTVLAEPAPGVEYISPDPTVYVEPAPVVEYTSPNSAEYAVAEYITPSPMEFVGALHEIDEEFCRDDFEELCYVAHMSRKRLWRGVWHGCSSPPGASKSERTWRRLSKRLCYEESFDEMKRTCAYCGMFEDEDDILVRCQGPDCSLRSADYEIPGVFHGRCAAALGHSGGARWQNCPW